MSKGGTARGKEGKGGGGGRGVAWVKEMLTAFSEVRIPFNGDIPFNRDFKFAHKRTLASVESTIGTEVPALQQLH